MKSTYRGYEINVRRSKCLAGYHMLYTTIMRKEDAFIAEEMVEDSGETVRDQIRYMKERIDNELATEDPWNERGTVKGWWV